MDFTAFAFFHGVPIGVAYGSLFALGAIFGSYMEVVRTRGAWQMSFSHTSQCLSCKKRLAWYELVPIVSFFALRGKCRSCNGRIAYSHIIAEMVFALSFVGIAVFADTLFGGIALLITAIFAVPILMTDIKKMEIPEHLSLVFAYVAFAIVVLYSCFTLGFPDAFPSLSAHMFSGLLLALPFFAVWFVSGGRAMGLGDAKLALPLGFFLSSAVEVVSVFIFSFWIGVALLLVVFVGMLALGRGGQVLRRGHEVPFGPSLILAFLFVFVTGITFADVVVFIGNVV